MRTPTKLTLTIKRLNGDIEKVIHPRLKNISKMQFKQMQVATKKAGKGDILSFDVEYKELAQATIKTSSDMFYAGVHTDNTVSNMSRMGD